MEITIRPPAGRRKQNFFFFKKESCRRVIRTGTVNWADNVADPLVHLWLAMWTFLLSIPSTTSVEKPEESYFSPSLICICVYHWIWLWIHKRMNNVGAGLIELCWAWPPVIRTARVLDKLTFRLTQSSGVIYQWIVIIWLGKLPVFVNLSAQTTPSSHKRWPP